MDGETYNKPNSINRPLNHNTSCAAAHNAYNSASHVDSATTFCFFDDQFTGDPHNFTIQPLIDLRSFRSFDQSESLYATISNNEFEIDFPFPPNLRPIER